MRHDHQSLLALPVLNTEAFRRKLAGLSDPSRPGGIAEPAEIRETAHRLCSILASLFGESLDRKTLWDRIGSALKTSVAKVDDGDLERFVSLCLEHVQADVGEAGRSEALERELSTYETRPAEWRTAFLAYVAANHYPVVVFGRRRWERIKSGEATL